MEPPAAIARMRNVAPAVVKCVKINLAASRERHLSHAMVRWGCLNSLLRRELRLLASDRMRFMYKLPFNSCRLNVRPQARHARLYRCWACWALGNVFFFVNIIKKRPVSAVNSTEGIVSLVMCDRGIH